jgi:hypothetical protein
MRPESTQVNASLINAAWALRRGHSSESGPDGTELRRLITDDNAHYHANGIAPVYLSKNVRDEVAENAEQVLASQFAEAIRRARIHFFQPIIDIEPTQLAFGRTVMVGDAAYVAPTRLVTD